MTETPSLELRVARRLRAIAESEGVDFAITEADPVDDEDYSQEEALIRALDRFQREHPELIKEIREWYLQKYPPLKDTSESAFSRERNYLSVFLYSHRPFYEIAQAEDDVGEHS